MSQTSPILALPYLQPSQAQKHVTHNEALRRLDVLVQLTVKQFNAVTPPDIPEEGDVYALGAAATAAWAGADHSLAAWMDGSWHFFTPVTGWRAWGQTEGELRLWDGASWAVPPGGDTQNLDGIGIGTHSDVTNKLAVQADATLLSHDGAGHQLKVNKAAATDTASLLFQSNWTGHAEMGLAGNTDFAIKVSPDGTGWTDALRIDANSGKIEGAAVQADPADTTPGLLTTVGSFGLGQRVMDQTSADDLNGLRDMSALVGNSSETSVPVNAPHASGSFVGLTASVDAHRGAQLMFDTLINRVYFRTDNGTWADWEELLYRSNILGTVSQSAGLPTGSVVERGENNKGEYVRFADGTQMCFRSASVNVATTNVQIWTFPMSFAGGRRRIMTSFSQISDPPHVALENSNIRCLSNDGGRWRLRLSTAGTSTSYGSAAESLSLFASGVWFE